MNHGFWLDIEGFNWAEWDHFDDLRSVFGRISVRITEMGRTLLWVEVEADSGAAALHEAATRIDTLDALKLVGIDLDESVDVVGIDDRTSKLFLCWLRFQGV